MRLDFSLLVSVLIILYVPFRPMAQGVGISSSGAAPDGSARLDIQSTNSGLLIPRMTTSNRDAISSSANSLLIYNTTTECFEAYHSGTSSWIAISCLGCQLPGPFTASAATNITMTTADINWAASGGATAYFLDIDDNNDFSSPVAGYDNLNVGNVTTYNATGLSCGTTYYYRLRANNSCGTSSNSNSITFSTLSCAPTCGSQVFATANINVGTLMSGAPGGSRMTSPGGDQKYCYNDLEANCTTYGGLYEWNEAMNYAGSINCDPCGAGGVQGICPAGFHIPTDLEWSRYEHCLESTLTPTGPTTLATFQTTTGFRGTNSNAGPSYKMKATSSDNPAWNGNDISGFTTVPAGVRAAADGAFSLQGSWTGLWSATASGSNSFAREFYSSDSRVSRATASRVHGYSLRCLQN